MGNTSWQGERPYHHGNVQWDLEVKFVGYRLKGKVLQGPSVRVTIGGDLHTSALALGAAVNAASRLQSLK